MSLWRTLKAMWEIVDLGLEVDMKLEMVMEAGVM